MKLLNTINLSGTIEVINGLHIGAGNEAVEIGGLDNQVIRNPLTQAPYIPGSSLKGKMRFLSEWKEDKVRVKNGKNGPEGPVHSCTNPDCSICRVFGSMEKVDKERGPTRLIVRDAKINGDFDHEKMIEVKYSTAIDRVSGTAKSGSLRNMERVAPGVKFALELVYRVFDLGDGGKADKDNFKMVLLAVQMVENDTLGGSGSRGCGKVAFTDLTLSGFDADDIKAATISDLIHTVKAK